MADLGRGAKGLAALGILAAGVAVATALGAGFFALGTAFWAVPFAADLLDVFTSCLLAVLAYAHRVRQPLCIERWAFMCFKTHERKLLGRGAPK